MIRRMEWAAGRKLRANAGETLTEVLISALVIALGMTLFLSAFLASGRMLQQGEEQMAGYYDSRNQLDVYKRQQADGTDGNRRPVRKRDPSGCDAAVPDGRRDDRFGQPGIRSLCRTAA